SFNEVPLLFDIAAFTMGNSALVSRRPFGEHRTILAGRFSGDTAEWDCWKGHKRTKVQRCCEETEISEFTISPILPKRVAMA
ncbi:hypothetical protein, partial [Tautonia rosea]|uniref:hypothetical protein n=1 Tax=Tautonia rosea TaxID=2728037 RepID=UPI0019CFBFD1